MDLVSGASDYLNAWMFTMPSAGKEFIEASLALCTTFRTRKP
jgi:hypothetical protein